MVKNSNDLVVPLWSKKQVATFLRWWDKKNSTDFTLTVESLSMEAEIALQDAGIPFRTSLFLWDQNQIFGKVEDTAEEWISEWYRSMPPRSVDEINAIIGIDFRRAIYVGLKTYLLESLRHFVTLEKILQKSPELLIINDGSLRVRMLRWLADQTGLAVNEIKVKRLNRDIITLVNLRKLVGDLCQKLKLRARGGITRAIIRNALSFRRKKDAQSPERRKSILLYGVERFPALFDELERTSSAARLLIYNHGPGSREVAEKYFRSTVDEINVYALSLLFRFFKKRNEIKRLIGELLKAARWETEWKHYDLKDLFVPVVETMAGRLVGNICKRCLLFGEFFRKYRIGKIIVWIDEKWKEKSVVLLARRKGILTAVIPHGAPGAKIGNLPEDADIIISWGRMHSGWYKKHGVESERLVELGNPEFDEFFNRDKSKARANIFKSLGLNPGSFLSVVALSGYVDKNLNISYRDLIALGLKFLEITSSLPNHFSFWKIHPGGYEKTTPYHNLTKSLSGEFRVDRYANNPELLSGCDALFTHDSDIGIEAMITNTPVFIMNFWKRKIALPYAEYIPGCEIADPGQLPGLIDRLRQDGGFRKEIIEKQNAFLSEYLSAQTSTSSERIARWIAGLDQP